MKLAKKMLACAMALAMVAAFALTAFAAAPVVSLTATQYKNVGDEITITVAATGMTGLEAADLEFAYDAEALEFVKIAKTADIKADMAAGDKVSDGVVTWSIVYMDGAEADSGLAVLTFKVLKDADTTVSVKYNSWAGTDEPAAAEVAVTKFVAPVTTTETTTATTTETTTVATTEAGSEVETTDKIPQTGEVGVAAIAGVMALAAVAFVATRKKDEE